jgi:hypothetical protein
LVFEKWPRYDIECDKTDHWYWKSRDTPVDINQIVIAETEDGKIIGASQAIFKRTKIGENIYIVRKGAGIAVHPDYRRMGVYSNIVRFRDERRNETGAVMTYALTDNPIIIRTKKGDSGETPEQEFPPIKHFIKIQQMDKFLSYLESYGKIDKIRSLQVQIGYNVLNIINKIRKALVPELKTDKEAQILEIKKFDNRINDLWYAVKNDYYWITEKKEDYLNWRYCDKRSGNNKVWIAQVNENIEGYIAVKVNKLDPDHPIGYIMELMSERNDGYIISKLIEKAVIYLIEQEVDAIYYCTISGNTYESMIKRHGFVDSMKRKHVFYKFYMDFEDLELLRNAEPERMNYQFGEFDSL